MPRPTKLTPDVQNRIVLALELGHTYETASEMGGIAYNTFNEWRKKGESAKSGQFYEFYEAIKAAESRFVDNQLALIQNAAINGTWTAAAWLLERRKPQQWAQRQYQKIDGLDELKEAADKAGVSLSDAIKALAAELNADDSSAEGETSP